MERRRRRGDRRPDTLLPLSWEWQGTLFAVLTLLAAWLWSKWLRKRVKTQRPADAQLNQRGQQLVGRRLTLDAPLVNGRGHVRVGDSSAGDCR